MIQIEGVGLKSLHPNAHTRNKMIKGKPWMNNSTLCKYQTCQSIVNFIHGLPNFEVFEWVISFYIPSFAPDIIFEYIF